VVAAALALAYVLVDPPSRDLAAHLFDAALFGQIGWAPWDTLWYAGHSPLGYSVLFPAIAAVLTPQLTGAVAAVGTAVMLERLVHRHLGRDGTPIAVLLAMATAINLYTGRLALAAGALPAMAAVVALDRRRPAAAAAAAILAALLSPLAALFCAIAAAGIALGEATEARRSRAGGPATAVALAALTPVAVLAVVFPQPGVEPFPLTTLLPVLGACVGVRALLPRDRPRLRAGISVYAVALILAYVIPSPIGSNIARLGTFAAAPLGVLALGRRARLLRLALVPLLYIGWQAPVSDVAATAGDPSTSVAYYRPLLAFLAQRWRDEGPFRVEIPFTASHWEALWVGRRFPLARGWERQLDVAANPLFYRGRLTAAAYHRWLEAEGVRYVAIPDARPDPSAVGELAVIAAHPPYLHPVFTGAHWRLDAVTPTPVLATGAAAVTGMEPDQVSLRFARVGAALIRVRFSPYWALAGVPGCVSADGPMTRAVADRTGHARLVIRFSPRRIAATGPRCN
jgi:hypothetical protein